MNSLQTTNQTMTVKEVAEILGVTERTIQRHLKNIRQNTDNVVGHGKLSLLNQEEVTKIKIKI
ncbi:MAG: HTH domain-containing protein, partial [Deltaproteobacteria bacterium]|nr:HTH domain-containing protein [Deltaproteobacteria bacterium]